MMSSMIAPLAAHSLACLWYVSMCQSSTASLLVHRETSLYQPASSGCSHQVRWMKPGLVMR